MSLVLTTKDKKIEELSIHLEIFGKEPQVRLKKNLEKPFNNKKAEIKEITKNHFLRRLIKQTTLLQVQLRKEKE